MTTFLRHYLRERIKELEKIRKHKGDDITSEPSMDTFLRGGIDELERTIRIIDGEEADGGWS